MATGTEARRARTWSLLLGACLLGLLACAPVPRGAGWRPRLVVMVVLDTCRADHLGCYGYARNTSPNIDRLAAEGVVFEQAFSQSNESLFSAASLLTSLYPQRIAPLDYDLFQMAPGDATWPARLQAAGWETAGFVAGGHWSRAFGFGGGFAVYDDHADFGSFYDTWPLASAWLEQRDRRRPAFLLLHSYDAHTPYRKPLGYDHAFDSTPTALAERIARVPEAIENVVGDRFFPDLPTRRAMRANPRGAPILDPSMFATLEAAARAGRPAERLAKRDMEHLVAHYDGGIAYADAYVGLLAARLRALGLERETLLVLLGDHGEDLAEHGCFNHRVALADASLRVPLVMWAPSGLPAGRRIPQVVQLVDVFPTIFTLAGLDYAPQVALEARSCADGAALASSRSLAMDGQSLMGLVGGARPEDGLAFAEGTLPTATARSAGARVTGHGRRSRGQLDPGSLRFTCWEVRAGREVEVTLSDPQMMALRASLLSWIRQSQGPLAPPTPPEERAAEPSTSGRSLPGAPREAVPQGR